MPPFHFLILERIFWQIPGDLFVWWRGLQFDGTTEAPFFLFPGFSEKRKKEKKRKENQAFGTPNWPIWDQEACGERPEGDYGSVTPICASNGWNFLPRIWRNGASGSTTSIRARTAICQYAKTFHNRWFRRWRWHESSIGCCRVGRKWCDNFSRSIIPNSDKVEIGMIVIISSILMGQTRMFAKMLGLISEVTKIGSEAANVPFDDPKEQFNQHQGISLHSISYPPIVMYILYTLRQLLSCIHLL